MEASCNRLDAFEERIGRVEQRVEFQDSRIDEVEKEVVKVKSNLTGTLEKPGTLELLRQMIAGHHALTRTVEDMSGKFDSLAEIVSKLNSVKYWAAGWAAGAIAVAYALIWAYKNLIK